MANLDSSLSSSDRPQNAPEPAKIKAKKSFAPAILIAIAFVYLGLVILLPAANVFVTAFSKGFSPIIEALKRPDFQNVFLCPRVMSRTKPGGMIGVTRDTRPADGGSS